MLSQVQGRYRAPPSSHVMAILKQQLERPFEHFWPFQSATLRCEFEEEQTRE